MRIVVTQNITLDGRIEMLDDWFDPADQDEEMLALNRQHSEAQDVLLLGRRTFEDFRGFWPEQTDDTTGVSEQLDRCDKRVITSTLTEPGWRNTTLLDRDPLEVARELRAGPDGEVCVTGSIQLTHALLAAGLVDEVRLFTYPVWQGRGRGLFPEGAAIPRMRVREARAFRCGVGYTALEPATAGPADRTRGTA
ncbi:dihydrofolate reductase family protein [Kytococcus sedentarius]|uniref:dihydrofolate reductase family protein n=1 Tax=Kytococcus sedentarius TaxID=1276 RepID=UPI0035BC3BA0